MHKAITNSDHVTLEWREAATNAACKCAVHGGGFTKNAVCCDTHCRHWGGWPERVICSTWPLACDHTSKSRCYCCHSHSTAQPSNWQNQFIRAVDLWLVWKTANADNLLFNHERVHVRYVHLAGLVTLYTCSPICLRLFACESVNALFLKSLKTTCYVMQVFSAVKILLFWFSFAFTQSRRMWFGHLFIIEYNDG